MKLPSEFSIAELRFNHPVIILNSERSENNGSKIPVSRIIRYLMPLVVIGLAVHFILPQITSLAKSYQVIKQMIPWALAAAFIAQFSSYLSSGYLLKSLVELSGSTLTIRRGTFLTLAGSSFGIVAGGLFGNSAVVYHWMRNENVNPEAATLSGFIPLFFYNFVLLLVSLVGLFHLLATHALSSLQAVSFGLTLFVLLALVGILFWGQRNRKSLAQFADQTGSKWARIRRQEYQPQRIHDWFSGLFNSFDILVSKGWRKPMLGAVLNYVIGVDNDP